jgi:hypothetical protein
MQDVITASNVTGLVGVEKDFWEAGGGTVYAIVRMNKIECASRYQSIISENEKIIAELKDEALKSPETFDAYENIVFAAALAVVTDNFQHILLMLNPSAISQHLSYGNADALRVLAANTARSIVITVSVDGDKTGRIENALSQFITARGFRTNAGGKNPYTLSASFETEEREGKQTNFVNYTLQCNIRDKNGIAVFSFSDADREGHTTFTGAYDRVLYTVEKTIASGAFAKGFDEYLGSLLES